MTRTRSGNRWRIALAIGTLLLVVAACSSDDMSSNEMEALTEADTDDAGEATGGAPATTEAPTDDMADDMAEEGAMAEESDDEVDMAEMEAPASMGDGDGGRDGALGNGGALPVVQPRDLGRDIIFQAEITVAVSDMASASAEATRIVERTGGILFGQETVGAPESRSVLTFKVEPGRFSETLEALRAIGEVRNQVVTADDVTERLVDLESQIATAEVSVTRLRELLEGAEGIEAVARIENQLLERETKLERLRGQVRTLRDQVALATITVTFTEALVDPKVRLMTTAYPGREDLGTSCPGEEETLAVDEETGATLCFEVANTGDTALADFTLTDTVLGIDLDDLDVVFGDPAETLDPGQSFVLAYELDVERSIATRTRVEATPVDEDGEPLSVGAVAQTRSFTVEALDPGGLPGFSEGLEGGKNLFLNIAGIVVLAVAWSIPFLWLIPLIGIAIWWRRRRLGPNTVVPPEAEA